MVNPKHTFFKQCRQCNKFYNTEKKFSRLCHLCLEKKEKERREKCKVSWKKRKDFLEKKK